MSFQSLIGIKTDDLCPFSSTIYLSALPMIIFLTSKVQKVNLPCLLPASDSTNALPANCPHFRFLHSPAHRWVISWHFPCTILQGLLPYSLRQQAHRIPTHHVPVGSYGYSGFASSALCAPLSWPALSYRLLCLVWAC